MAEFDFSELDKLAADLESVPDALPKQLAKALGVTSKKVKESAQKKVRKRKYFSGGAKFIDYELKGESGDVSSMSSEIGYNRDMKGGGIGRLIELGAPDAVAFMSVKDKKTGKWKDVPVPGKPSRPLPPGGELQAALHENEDDFVTGIERAVADAMEASGL